MNQGTHQEVEHPLISFPPEPLDMIFDRLGLVASTSFSLTRETVYKHYKKAYPHPVSLDTLSCHEADGDYMQSPEASSLIDPKLRLSYEHYKMSLELDYVLYTELTRSGQYRRWNFKTRDETDPHGPKLEKLQSHQGKFFHFVKVKAYEDGGSAAKDRALQLRYHGYLRAKDTWAEWTRETAPGGLGPLRDPYIKHPVAPLRLSFLQLARGWQWNRPTPPNMSPWSAKSRELLSLKPPSLLPNPHNMGDDWYAEAIEAIIKDRDHWSCGCCWMTFWEGTAVFQDHREDWKAFNERWIENHPLDANSGQCRWN